MKLAGASRSATGRGIDPLAARSNYFIGTDPKRWTRDVPHFSQVEYRGVYPGVDVPITASSGSLNTISALRPAPTLSVFDCSLKVCSRCESTPQAT
jgi:hypothetical protein